MSDSGKAVFLSYASQDADAARHIADALRAAGIEVWFDQSELRGGDAWDQKIRRQIKDCALFVPIISVNTQSRPEGYFRLEWRLADQRTHLMGRAKAFVLPVCVDTTRDADADVPDSFLDVQWTRLPDGETPPAFVERVKALLAGEVGPVSDRPHPRESAASPTKHTLAWPKLTLALIVVGAAASVAVVILRPWRSPGLPNPVAPATPANPAPQTEAQRLVVQVRKMVVDYDNGVLARDNLEAAEGLCEQALKLEPTNAEAWALASEVSVAFYQQTYDRTPVRQTKIRSQATRAIKLAPDLPEAQFAVANDLRLEQATLPEAERIYRRLVERFPEEWRYLSKLATVLERQGRAAELPALYQRIAQRGSDDPAALLARYQSAMVGGRTAEAEQALDLLLAKEPNEFAYQKKLNLVINRADLEEARRVVAGVPPTMLRNENIAYLAVVIWLNSRNFEEARAALQAVPGDFVSTAQFKGPKAYGEAFIYLLEGRREAARLKFESALQLIEQHLAGNAGDLQLLYLKAQILAYLDRKSEAELTQRVARELHVGRDPTVVDIGFSMAMGRYDEVIAQYEAWDRAGKLSDSARNWMRLNFLLDPLRGDPRFEALLRETLPKGAKPFDDPKPEAGRQKPAAAPLNIDQKSIAVLPFTNMSENKEANAFFADGMHEDVITNLALIRELRVVSRTTAMQYRDTKKSLREIGAELGVAYILEGSVRRIGNKVRVTGQLIDARTDQHVWAKSYDRDLTDIFAIQSELAQAIATALQAALSPQEKSLLARRPTENLAAYDLFLQARDIRNREGVGLASLQKQEPLLQSAVALDPGFAAAWAELHYTHAVGYYLNFDHTEAKRAKAKAAHDNAVRLAPDAPEVIRTRGDFRFLIERDYARAMEYYEQRARLQPNEPTVYWSLSNIQRRQGRWAETAANSRQATQLDPGNVNYARILAMTLRICRRYDEAITEQRRTVALVSGKIGDKYTLALLPFEARGSTKEMDDFLGGLPETEANSREVIGIRKAWAQRRGDLSEAVRLDRLQPYSNGDPITHRSEALDAAVTLAAQGDLTAARARLESLPAELRARLELDPTNPDLWSELGRMEAVLGHREEALRCARKAMELMPESLDALLGPTYEAALAFVYAWTGDKDHAVAEYGRLLRGKVCTYALSWNNLHCLKHGPWAYPLRDDPRFQALLDDPASNAPLF
jgi:TolB-like protein/Flp pilus assembly protein TadD